MNYSLTVAIIHIFCVLTASDKELSVFSVLDSEQCSPSSSFVPKKKL